MNCLVVSAIRIDDESFEEGEIVDLNKKKHKQLLASGAVQEIKEKKQKKEEK